MNRTQNSLPEKVRIQVAGLMQGALADAIDLTIQAKHAHWNVKGPNFIAIHKLFDELAEESEDYSDLIAERIAQLGGTARGTLQAVATATKLPVFSLEASTEKEHLWALSATLAGFGESLRKLIQQTAQLQDPVTADIFTGIARGVDKYLWFVETHVQADRPGERLSSVQKSAQA